VEVATEKLVVISEMGIQVRGKTFYGYLGRFKKKLTAQVKYEIQSMTKFMLNIGSRAL